MQIKNSELRYGLMAISFHWVMAVLIIGMLALGLYMVGMPISLQKLRFYGLHKEFGLLVLFLVIFRFGWRLANIDPNLPADMPVWQQWAARLVQWALIGFMFAMPITGWLLTSAAGLAPSFFGLFTLPVLISPNDDLRQLLGEVHKWLAYGLIAAICAHAGAALHHHFINKDDVLRRMLP
jgi:cytochrome b561